MKSMAAVVLVLFATVAMFGQEKANGEALALLQAVAQRYRQANTYHFELVRERTVTGDLSRSWMKQLYVFAKGAAGQYHYESKEANGWDVVMSDGSKQWMVRPWQREYVETAVAAKDTMRSPVVSRAEYMRKRMATLDEAVVHAEIVGTENVSIGDQQFNCTILKVEHKPPRMLVAHIDTIETFWVDTRTKLVRKEHVLETGQLYPDRPKLEATADATVLWTVAEAGTSPSADFFRYKPDEDSRMVDRLTSPAARNLTGETAPPLNLKRLDGSEVTPDAFKGKVLVVDFWASWCAPCVAQMPFIASLNKKFKDRGVVVVGVNKDPDPKKAIAFLEKNNYDWLNLYDEKVEASKRWGTDAVPTFAVVDSSGKVVLFRVGYNSKDEAEIRAVLDKLVPAQLK